MKQRQKNNLDVSGCSSNSLAKKNSTSSQFSVLPVFPSASKASLNRRHTSPLKRSDKMLHNSEDIIMTPCNAIIVQTTVDGKIQVSRTQKERDRNPDRLSLDKRDLSVFPILVGESKLRLLSLQHNLLAKLERMALQCLPQLVFLDIYNNQLENMSAFDCLHHLRVLLLGKNRIKTIEGLTNMTRLEVLDLHGNRINEVQNLKNQKELKVLNLAGNEIKSIGARDLEGLHSLQEMNLRRNQIKTLQGFHETPQLFKLFLSNNDISSIDDLEGLTKLQQLKELSLDGNTVMGVEDCIFYIISHISSVQIFGQTRITDDIRKVARVWRLRREFNEKPSASLDSNERLKPLTNDDLKRTRSASENRISYLRKRSAGFRFFKADQKNAAPTKFLHRSQSSGQPTRMLEKSVNTRRLTYSRGKTVSTDSCAGSETSVEYFRLPPILSFSSNLMDDCNVTIRNDPNTSVESNKSCCSFRKDSSSSVEKNDSSSSECESESSEDDKCDDQVPVITKNMTPTLSIDKEKNVAERMNDEPVEVKTPFISETKNVKLQRGNARFERVKEQGGDYLVQISGRFLFVTGKNSAKHIDKAWSQEKACDVTTIKFSCVLFNTLVPVFSRIKLRFPNVENLIFNECEFNYLGQLNALADIQGLTSLEILPDRNDVVKKNWRCYAIYRLHHWGLQTINNEPITEDEVKTAKDEFRGLSEMVLWSLPKSLLTPLLNKLRLEINSNVSAKQWLFKADPALRNVICKEALQWRSPASLSQSEIESRERGKQTLTTTVEAGCNMVLKLRRLEKQWKPIMQEVVFQALKDLSDKEVYCSKEINDLKPP